MRLAVVICCLSAYAAAVPPAPQVYTAELVQAPPPAPASPENTDTNKIINAVVDNLPDVLDALEKLRGGQNAGFAGFVNTMDSFLDITRKIMTSMAINEGSEPDTKQLDNLNKAGGVMKAFLKFMNELTDLGVVSPVQTPVTVSNVDLPPLSIDDLAPFINLLLSASSGDTESPSAGSPVSPSSEAAPGLGTSGTTADSGTTAGAAATPSTANTQAEHKADTTATQRDTASHATLAHITHTAASDGKPKLSHDKPFTDIYWAVRKKNAESTHTQSTDTAATSHAAQTPTVANHWEASNSGSSTADVVHWAPHSIGQPVVGYRVQHTFS